ncbi:hypothetical protein BX666DRAFT_1873702 [Dichotomocladium elegans]|nr:hypothetical protein BX666DRAFT_1873702 [Dichotomocladium elegans]
MDFLLDFSQVLRMTALRYRSGSYMTTELTKELVLNGLLNDGFFSSTSATSRSNESESDWYFYDGLLDDDEDDIQDDEIEDRFDDDGESTENWNLVDVMPSFGRPNGEGESIFQFGATVMGMMESLGGRNVISNVTGSTTSDPTSSSMLSIAPVQAAITSSSARQQNMTSSDRSSSRSVYQNRLNTLKRHAGFPF